MTTLRSFSMICASFIELILRSGRTAVADVWLSGPLTDGLSSLITSLGKVGLVKGTRVAARDGGEGAFLSASRGRTGSDFETVISQVLVITLTISLDAVAFCCVCSCNERPGLGWI